MYAWLAIGMVAATASRLAEKSSWLKWLARPLLLTAGYGPLLCAVTFSSYIAELRGREMKWDKTVKTGKVSLSRGN